METLDLLNRYPPTAALPIIVCTAARREIGAVERLLRQRGVRILHKPFAIDDLLGLIQQVVA